MSISLPLAFQPDPAKELASVKAELHMARQRDRQAREMFALLAGLPVDRSLEEMYHQIRRKMGEVKRG